MVLGLWAFVGALGLDAWAQAAPISSIYSEFAGIRSLAMGGAHRALADSNDAVILNPAGLARRRRYHMDVMYGYTGVDALSHLHTSAVDSASTAVAFGSAYTYALGDSDGLDVDLHRVYFGTAYALMPQLSLGISARHVRGGFFDGRERQRISQFNGDVGLVLDLFAGLTFGFVYHNVFRNPLREFNPSAFAFGLGYGASIVSLSADLVFENQDGRRPMALNTGGELFLFRMLAMRAGYAFMPNGHAFGVGDEDHRLSGGLGLVDSRGAVDVAYRQSLRNKDDWTLVASLKLFVASR